MSQPAPCFDRHLTRQLIAFSSEADVPEQIASLRSFLANVGVPPAITIVGDGSHRPDSRALLEAQHERVTVMDWDEHPTGIPDALWHYSRVSPWGKKLIGIATVLRRGPAIYADSDVLFFKGARDNSALTGPGAWFLGDLEGGLDSRCVLDAAPAPASGGFFITDGSGLPLDAFYDRIPPGLTDQDAFIEQSIIHLALHAVSAAQLSPETFVLHVEDHFKYRDATAGQPTVLRHYIGMVRYKYWLAVGRLSRVGI